MGAENSTARVRWALRVVIAAGAALCPGHATLAAGHSAAGLHTGYFADTGAASGRSHAALGARAALQRGAWACAAGTELHNWSEGRWTGAGLLEGGYRRFLPARLHVDLSAAAVAHSHSIDARTGRWAAAARLARGSSERGAWIDGGAGRAWNGTRWLGFSRTGAGATRTLGPAVVTLSASLLRFADEVTQAREGNWIMGRDSILVYVPGRDTRHALRTCTDTRVDVHWAAGALELDGQAGLRWDRSATDAPGWARLRGTWWVGPRWALVAEAGRNPAIPEEGLPAERVGYLGLRVDLTGTRATRPAPGGAPPALAVYRIRGDLRRIQLALGGAERVEMAGDFNDWQPIALTQTGPGLWQARLVLAPGAYRVSIRTEASDWTAPPGLPSQPDEFGRSAGLLIVR